MQKVAAGVFKAKCLSLIDEVDQKREEFIVTKRGRPVAKLIPVEQEKDDIFGFYAGKLKIIGDIVSPAIPLERWKRLK